MELLLIQRNQYYNPLFDLNKVDNNAQHLLYTEIPQTLCLGKKKLNLETEDNKEHKRNCIMFNPKQSEQFHLCQILLHACGPTCFEDLLTFNGVRFNSFVETTYARRIQPIIMNGVHYSSKIRKHKYAISVTSTLHLFVDETF